MFPFGLEVEQAQAEQQLRLEWAAHRRLVAEACRFTATDGACMRMMRTAAFRHSVRSALVVVLRTCSAALAALAERMEPEPASRSEVALGDTRLRPVW